MLVLERSPPDFWHAFQDRMLAALAAHLRVASPFWRDWLAPAGAQLSRRTLADLPILRRSDFRAAVDGGPVALPPDHGGTVVTSTSGSSGSPVSFHVSKWAHRMVSAQYAADVARHRLDGRKPLAVLLSRFPRHDGPHVELPANVLLQKGPRFERRTQGVGMAEHARWLRTLGAAHLVTAPTALEGLLDEWDAGAAKPHGLESVLTVGETVRPGLRERLRGALGLPILDRYSCEEIGPIALQCPLDETRYHVCVANAVVEVVDDEGAPCGEGVAGNVLVTGLHHWAAPAVRYELGDMAALHATCSCGERVPALSSLLGRKRFLLRLPSGERIFMSVNAKHWTDVAPVRQHRLTQVSEGEVLAEVVLDRPLTAQERDGLLAMLGRRSHPGLAFRLEQVAAIQWAPGAKRQDLVSLV